MRLDSLRLKNIGALVDVTLDLSDLGDGARIIAVTGSNGSGKTTLLEAGFAGALYRTTPTRGSLTSLATARESFVESTVVNGRSYTIRHVVDAVSAKGESVALGADGKPLFESSKVRDFDRWAAKSLPPPEVFFSTMFAPQGAGGFLGAKPGERKAVLLRALGIERLEAIAECAREHKREAKVTVDALDQRIADERARGGDVAELEQHHRSATEVASERESDLEKTREALEQARRQAQEHAQAARDAEVTRERRARLQADIDQGKGTLADLDERIANNRKVLGDAERIRFAATGLEAARAQVGKLQTESARLNAERDSLKRRSEDIERQFAAAKARLAQADGRLGEGASIRAAAKQLPELEAAAKRADDQVAEARKDLEALQGQRAAGAEERCGKLRDGLSEIAAAAHETDGDRLGSMAVDTITKDDQAVEQAASLPHRLAAQKEALAGFEQAAREARHGLERVRATVAKLEALEQAQVDRDAAQAELATLEGAPEACEEKLRAVEATFAGIGETLAKVEQDIAELEPAAKLLDPLNKAEARLAEIEPQREELAQQLAALEAELLATPELVIPSRQAPDVAGLSRAVTDAEQALSAAAKQVVVASERLSAAQTSASRLASLKAELANAHGELVDWSRLADDLGRNGLQAAEIDAAGPELTTLANDLLHECHGPRFTVRVDTQRLSSDGKRQIEGCEVVVIDTVGGREAPGETFSGGERVILGEALSLALTMLACRRSGVDGPTLVRDESGAALDPDNGRVYLAMLRRAADVVGASRVLFVSHDPALAELADARIEVSGGSARVV